MTVSSIENRYYPFQSSILSKTIITRYLYYSSAFDRAFLRDIANLNTGAAAGVSRALLSYFGEYVPLPYYHGGQIEFRNFLPVSNEVFTLSEGEHFTLKIYPNPSKSDISIALQDSELTYLSISVYDIFGQKISEVSSEIKSPFHMETGSWNTGVYWIVARDNLGVSHFGKALILRN